MRIQKKHLQIGDAYELEDGLAPRCDLGDVFLHTYIENDEEKTEYILIVDINNGIDVKSTDYCVLNFKNKPFDKLESFGGYDQNEFLLAGWIHGELIHVNRKWLDMLFTRDFKDKEKDKLFTNEILYYYAYFTGDTLMNEYMKNEAIEHTSCVLVDKIRDFDLLHVKTALELNRYLSMESVFRNQNLDRIEFHKTFHKFLPGYVYNLNYSENLFICTQSKREEAYGFGVEDGYLYPCITANDWSDIKIGDNITIEKKLTKNAFGDLYKAYHLDEWLWLESRPNIFVDLDSYTL